MSTKRVVVRRLRRRPPTKAELRAWEIISDQRHEVVRELLPSMLSGYVGAPNTIFGPDYQTAAETLVNFAFAVADQVVEHLKAQNTEKV